MKSRENILYNSIKFKLQSVKKYKVPDQKRESFCIGAFFNLFRRFLISILCFKILIDQEPEKIYYVWCDTL